MESGAHLTVIAAFEAATGGDASRPLITFYDDATGERTELSGVTLRNWVAKTANLLVDGCALGTGDIARVALPPHWQTAAVLLGVWSAGLAVDMDGSGGPAAVAFTTVDGHGDAEADEVFVLALAPMAAPVRPGPPPGAADYVVEVRGHGDQFPGGAVSPQTTALADGTPHAELVARARQRGVPPGARLLIDGDATTDPVDWLVAPLVSGASIVLCRNLEPARREARLATERATPWPPS